MIGVDDISTVISDKRLSEMDASELVHRQLMMFREDKEYRDKHTNFTKARYLYERRTSAPNGSTSNGIPTRNLIRRAVDDRHALALANIPKTKLVANLDVDQTKTFVERFVTVATGKQTEETLNAHVENILRENRTPDKRNTALKHAAIYGVGYINVDIDQSADTRFSPALRQLVRDKPLAEWTEKDANLYAFLTNRIEISTVNAPDVYWQHGIREVGERMMRVSLLERGDVNTLRRLYDNPLIRPGQFPNDVDEDPDYDGSIAAILTTWELEPVSVTYTLEIEDQDEELMEVETTDWVMVKTVIVGGQLVEKTITGNFEDEESGVEIGHVQLPIIPYYLQKSEEHPYGYSIPEQMEISEEFINRMYLILYKTARKAASNQGMIINAKALGDGDIFKIQQMLDEGGVAVIRGNGPQSMNMDLSKVVVPLNPYNGQLPVSVVEAVRNEEAGFKEMSGAVNLSAVSRARSGSGKRAEVTAADRPKTAQVGYISTSEELLYEAVYNLVQIYHKDHVTIPVELPGKGRQYVPINMPIKRILPILDDTGNPVFNEAFLNPEIAGPMANEMGIAMAEIEFIINSVSVNMVAISDGRSELPHDVVQRLQIVSALHNIAPLEQETLHDILLPREIKVINEAYREKRLQQEKQLQDVLTQVQSQGGGQTSFPQLTEADSLSNLIQDVQSDQRQGSEELRRDQQQLSL